MALVAVEADQIVGRDLEIAQEETEFLIAGTGDELAAASPRGGPPLLQFDREITRDVIARQPLDHGGPQPAQLFLDLAPLDRGIAHGGE